MTTSEQTCPVVVPLDRRQVFRNPQTPLNHARLQPWEGSSTTLETRLVNPPNKIIHQARKLLNWQNSCGAYLARLEDTENEHITGRVTSHRRNGLTVWTMQPPRWFEPTTEPVNAEPDSTSLPPPPACLVS